MRVRVASQAPKGTDLLAVPVHAGCVMPSGSPIEADVGYLRGRGFEGKVAETHPLVADGGRALIAIGVGEPGKLSTDGLRRIGAAAVRAAGRAKHVALMLAPDVGGREAAQAVAEGALLASYSYAGRAPREGKPALDELVIVTDASGARAGAARGETIATAVCLARDLINEPAGTLTPTKLAGVARNAASGPLSVRVLDERQIRAARLGGLLGVAQGSDQPPRLIELLYEPPGATSKTPTIAFVGKGITFDSGGLSLKTGAGMMTMKTDMSGAAAVIASMTAIADLGAPVRVLGICPTTENMPSGKAIRPGDVLKTRNGTTVEVLNTDAEGRLVLADGLALAVEAGVDAIVDLATLTGAVSVALGRKIAAIMGNDDAWTSHVRDAADRAGEKLWPLPLPAEYRRDIDSDVADLKNISGNGDAGTLIAGLFLAEFVAGVPWSHLDIAGTARADGDDGYLTRGGTGWGVRTLIELATAGGVATRDGATRRARWKGSTPAAKVAKPRS